MSEPFICSQVVWRIVACPTCHAPAGLACEDDDGYRQPQGPHHEARIKLFCDLTEYGEQLMADLPPTPSTGDEHLPPPLEDDRVAMMLGLVPDKRTPEERLWDAVRTNGESLKYRYEGEDE